MSLALQRVLFVEEDEDDFIIVRDLLAHITPAGAEVEPVSSFEAACDALARGNYSACRLDYHRESQVLAGLQVHSVE